MRDFGEVLQRTLLIRKADIIEELDVGGEISEVSLGITDAALPNTLALRRLPSGKLGWQDNCDLRLPVGLVPAEWQGRALLVTISLAPGSAARSAPWRRTAPRCRRPRCRRRPAIRSLARGRLWACGVLGAIPREDHRGEIQREAAALRTSEAECDRLGELLEASKANERRLVDQLQRLETALSTEQGLRAGAERFALEANALKQQLEDLRSRLQVAEADWRRLAVASRALSDALEVGGGLSTAGNVALGNVRRALGMVP